MNKDKTNEVKGFAAASGEGARGGSGGIAALSGAVSKSNSSSIATSKKPDVASTTSTTSTTKAAPPTKRTKKRGPTKKGSMSSGGGGSSAEAAEEETNITSLSETTTADFKPLSLQQIKLRLSQLIDKLPKDLPEAPPDYNNDTTDKTLYEQFAPIKKWANTIQVIVEEYNLLISLVAAATYKWGVDRSGASQQNLSVMNAELQQCQEVISNVVSPRLSNVLCPAVDVLIGKIEIIRDGKGDEGGDGDDEAPAKKRKLNDDRLSATATNSNSTGNEKRINHYTRPLVDQNYSHLCHCILARNAEMIRHTVATSIYTAQKVIGDYLNAMKTDSSHEASKGGYY